MPLASQSQSLQQSNPRKKATLNQLEYFIALKLKPWIFINKFHTQQSAYPRVDESEREDN